jgi:hypothetical protein
LPSAKLTTPIRANAITATYVSAIRIRYLNLRIAQ